MDGEFCDEDDDYFVACMVFLVMIAIGVVLLLGRL
jgi:hypothetical protein